MELFELGEELGQLAEEFGTDGLAHRAPANKLERAKQRLSSSATLLAPGVGKAAQDEGCRFVVDLKRLEPRCQAQKRQGGGCFRRASAAERETGQVGDVRLLSNGCEHGGRDLFAV